MTALVAILAALGAAVLGWFAARRAPIKPTGSPTDPQAEVRASAQAQLEAQSRAKEIEHAPDSVVDARLAQLMQRGKRGK